METREYTALPPEFSRPAPEFAAPPPDEFDQGSGPQTPKNKHRKFTKWLYAAAVLVVAALAIGKWGGASASSGDTFPVSPRQDGDPEITISRAIIMRAASSDYSMVGYTYSLDNHDTPFPIYLFTQVTDINGKKTDLTPSPAFIREKIVDENQSIETTGLYNREGMVLTLYAGWDTEAGIKWIAESRPVEEEYFPEITFTVDSAVYYPRGGSLGERVEYTYTLDAEPDCYPFTVYSFAEDQNNYVRGGADDPATVTQSQKKGSGVIYTDGMEGDLSVHMNATFSYEGGEVTIFAEAPVDMSNKVNHPTFPLGSGNIVLTVYNNSYDMETRDDPDFPYMKILAHETIPEDEFREFILPPAEYVGEDWDNAGYILHYNCEFDHGYDPSAAEDEFVLELGPVLTIQDVETVPPAADGNRYVNIHVMWISNSPMRPKLEIILDLYDGEDELVEGDTPFASEGYLYLAAVPIPEREGYTFTGWYDSENRKVEFVSYYDFFPLFPGATSREDRDWTNPQAVELHAGWKKN